MENLFELISESKNIDGALKGADIFSKLWKPLKIVVSFIAQYKLISLIIITPIIAIMMNIYNLLETYQMNLLYGLIFVIFVMVLYVKFSNDWAIYKQNLMIDKQNLAIDKQKQELEEQLYDLALKTYFVNSIIQNFAKQVGDEMQEVPFKEIKFKPIVRYLNHSKMRYMGVDEKITEKFNRTNPSAFHLFQEETDKYMVKDFIHKFNLFPKILDESNNEIFERMKEKFNKENPTIK